MPTILSAVNGSGVINVTHEEGEQDGDGGDDVVDAKKVQDLHSHHVGYYYNPKCHQQTQTELSALSFASLVCGHQTIEGEMGRIRGSLV